MKSEKDKRIYTHIDRMRHMSWCIKNDIKIYFEPTNSTEGVIVLIEKGKKFVKQEIYKQQIGRYKLKAKDKRYWEEIYKMYTSKYLEYNK